MTKLLFIIIIIFFTAWIIWAIKRIIGKNSRCPHCYNAAGYSENHCPACGNDGTFDEF